jgi:hypothetical protein
MAALPFTPAVTESLSSNPVWTVLACTYLSRFNVVWHLQRANLDAPENRDIVEDTLNNMKNNPGEILAISIEARDSSGVNEVGRVEEDTIFETIDGVKTCIVEITEYIFTTAQNAPWGFPEDRSARLHRMVIIAISCEVLADLGNIGGYFNHQLYTKHKQVKTPEKSKTRKNRGGNDGSHLGSDLEQEVEPEHKRARTEGPGDDSPLFMEQDEDFHTVEHDHDVSWELFDQGYPSILDTTVDDQTAQDGMVHQRADGVSSNSSLNNIREPGKFVKNAHRVEEIGGGRPSLGDLDEERQVALSTTQASTPLRARRLVSRTTRDYEALMKDFKLLSQTHESLQRQFAKRRRVELNVCQGNCFNDLEEADHRNWEKGQEIDSLKASVAGLQSQVEVLNSVVAERDGDYKEKCGKNIQLKARIQELEQQAKKGKSVRFAAGTK